MGSRIAVVAAALGGCLVACTLMLDFDGVQCNTGADCSTTALASSPYACLTDKSTEAGATTTTFDGRVVFYDVAKSRSGFGTKTLGGFQYYPLVGTSVRVCTPLDTPCTAPLTTATTDADGAVRVTFKQETPVYLDLRDPGLMPALFFPPEHFRAFDQALLVGMTTEAGFAANGAQAGIDMSKATGPDASTGHVVAAAYDCTRGYVEGVTWKLDDMTGATRAYVVNGLMSTTATATSADGYAIIFNARPRSTQITATYAGQEVLSTSILVRAGATTVVYAWP